MPSISSGAYCFSHERNSQFSSSCSRERPWILDRSVSISGLLSSVLFDGFIPASLGMVPLLPTTTREIVAGLGYNENGFPNIGTSQNLFDYAPNQIGVERDF